MIIVAGTARIAEPDLERARVLGMNMVKATRLEAGCLAYSFAADLEDPCLIHIFERWDDQTALDAHFQTPHMAAFNEGMAALSILDISVRVYEVSAERENQRSEG